MILTSIFVCFCLASAINYVRTRRQRSLIKNLKGPFTWPLLGSMHKLVLLTPKNFFQRSGAYLAKYGSFTRCWVFHRLFIPLTDLELANQLLYNEDHLATGNQLLRDWLKGGVLMCQKDQWSHRHQLLTKLFDQQNFFHLMELCRHQAMQLQLKLTEKANREVFNVWKVVTPIMADLMVQITCGVRPTEDYVLALKSLTELYRKRFLSCQSANRFTFWLSCPLMRRRQLRLIKQLNTDHIQFINQNKRQMQIKNDCFIIDRFEPINYISHRSLLDILMDQTDEEICAELNTCNNLGYLLCSTTICFILAMIARHPNVQNRCQEEVKKGQNSSGWNLQHLPFLEAVILETLRLYPPQVIVGRELSVDFPYTHTVVGDGVLPAGAEIYINLFEMQRNADHQLNPHHFLPERFLHPNPPELLSFGLGPRSCPARQFTVALLKSILAPILAKFELLPYGDALRLDLQLVLGSQNGFQLALRER